VTDYDTNYAARATIFDDGDAVEGDHVASLYAELGEQPRGDFNDVSDRLDVLEAVTDEVVTARGSYGSLSDRLDAVRQVALTSDLIHLTNASSTLSDVSGMSLSGFTAGVYRWSAEVWFFCPSDNNDFKCAFVTTSTGGNSVVRYLAQHNNQTSGAPPSGTDRMFDHFVVDTAGGSVTAVLAATASSMTVPRIVRAQGVLIVPVGATATLKLQAANQAATDSTTDLTLYAGTHLVVGGAM
jgi:hypothetical protein